jgi:Tol biopolymer transport system component
MEEQQVDVSFSPDGRFVLYQSENDVYVQPVATPGRRQLIAKDGRDPVWRGDGKEIAFIRLDDGVWSVAVSSSGGTPTFGVPTRLFGGIRRAANNVALSQSLAVSRDGSRFFVVQGVAQPEAGVIHVRTAALR